MAQINLGLSHVVDAQNKAESQELAVLAEKTSIGPVVVDYAQLRNAMGVIVGSSGSGKTTLMNEIFRQMAGYIPSHAISFHGDLKGAQFYLNGLSRVPETVRIGVGDWSINLFDIPQGFKKNQLRAFATEVVNKMALPRLGSRQRLELVDEVCTVLLCNGQSGEDGIFTLRELVGVEHVFDALRQRYIRSEHKSEKDMLAGVIGRLEPLVSSGAFRADNCVEVKSLLNKTCIYDLSGLDKAYQGVVASVLTRSIMRELRSMGEQNHSPIPRLMLMIDEVQILLGGDRSILEEIFQEYRKFGLGLTVATQNYSALEGEDVRVINNASLFISLANNNRREARMISRDTGLWQRFLQDRGILEGGMRVAYKQETHTFLDMRFAAIFDQNIVLNHKGMMDGRYWQEMERHQQQNWLRETVRREEANKQHAMVAQPPQHSWPSQQLHHVHGMNGSAYPTITVTQELGMVKDGVNYSYSQTATIPVDPFIRIDDELCADVIDVGLEE